MVFLECALVAVAAAAAEATGEQPGSPRLQQVVASLDPNIPISLADGEAALRCLLIPDAVRRQRQQPPGGNLDAPYAGSQPSKPVLLSSHGGSMLCCRADGDESPAVLA